MRNRLVIGTAALLLASMASAWAQDKPQGSTGSTTAGTIDVGGRFGSVDGDKARYERYRDLRDGANVNVLFSKETPDWAFDVKAVNIGYRDGNYLANFNSQRLKFSLVFDQTPLNYSYDTRTPYNCTAGNCTLNPGLRAQVAAKTAVGVPQTPANLLAGSVYNSIANPFDLQSRRDTFGAKARFSATNNLDFTLDFNTYKRSGNQPYGASFAFSVATELPIVVDNRTTDVTLGVEWASHQGMFRVAYQHSKFDQAIPSFTFDNPQLANDWNKTPGTGYDPSGYSNGNGAAFGRTALPPTNTMDTVSWMGMVKLPGRTTANASFAMGAARQDAALIPWTTNSVIANANTYKTFPNLAELPRETANMNVNFATATANVSSRPSQYLTLTARYRFNSRSDFTREFDGVEYVRFDAVPEETGGFTEPFNLTRNTLDVNAALTPIASTALRFGYGYDKWEHGFRATEGWKDNTARVSFDWLSNQYVTLRASYEHTKRDSIGLDVEDLIEGGMQPAARFFDEASRTRNRGTFIAEINPVSAVSINLSFASGKDDYEGADSSQLFGLLNNKNTTYTVGVDVTPNEKVHFGAEYGRETFNALQQSRTANPDSGVPGVYQSWTDPNRNWNLTNDETVNNFSAYLNLVKALAKTDIRISYDYSDSDQAFVHGGPRITAMQNNSILTVGDAKPCPAGVSSCFVALPNVTDKWHRFTVDVRYELSKNFGVGLAYWFEKLDVADYGTVNTAGPSTLPVPALGAQTDTARIDWLGSITTGYGNRPYKGQTAFVRVFYFF